MSDFYCAFGSGGELSVKSSWILQGPQDPESMERNCPGLHAIFENDPAIQRVVFQRAGECEGGGSWNDFQIYGRVQPEPEPEEDPRDLLKAQLLTMIEDYSEGHYAAGWYSGIEDMLWEQGGLWKILGEAIGEWPYRGSDTDYDIVWRPLPGDAS